MRQTILRWGIRLGVLLLLVLLANGGYKYYLQTTMKSTSKSFVNEVLHNQATASYNQFSTDAQKNIDKSIWSDQVSQLSSFFGATALQDQQTELVAGTHLVTYQLKGSDGTYKVTTILVRSGWQWKVKSFTSALVN